MAIMHSTTLVPSKLELLAAWLPQQSWFSGDVSQLTSLGSYRLDDPNGEVGIEGHLLGSGDDTVYHVPLTYRSAPLADSVDGGSAFAVGTSEHGVLGTRYFSDAAGDPVFQAVIAETIALGRHEAGEFVQSPAGELREREVHTRLRGSGHPDERVPEFAAAEVETVGLVTRIVGASALLEVQRVLETSGGPAEALEPGAKMASVHWESSTWPAVAAILRSV